MFGEGYSSKRGEARPDLAPAGPDGSGLPMFGGGSGMDIAEYWRLLVKHRLIILGVFLAAIVAGLAVTLLMTPTYTASATIQIDREAARVLDVADVTPRDSMIQGEEFFQTQYGLLRSRSLAERVIEDLGLASSDAFIRQMNAKLPRAGAGSAATQAARRKEAVLRLVRNNLSVAPVRGSRLVTVSFESPDPALSSRVANAFSENFIQSNLDRKYQSSGYAREFLEDRIAQTKARLEDSERQLVAYATAQQIINVQDEGNTNTSEARSLATANLVSLNSALAEARANRVAAEEKWRQARSSGMFTMPEALANPAIQRLVEERAKIAAQYEEKSRIFQPDWPEMVRLKAQQDELDRQINTVGAGIRSSIQATYTIAVNQERSLQTQVDGLKDDVLDLRARSIEYNILQREVDTSRTLYDGLLQRYKEVGITGGVAANNISIIDEAEPPTKPSKPRLVINVLIAALLGLGLGVVTAFLLEALDESLATPEDVESKLGTMVLGVIPLLDKGQAPITALSDVRSSFSEAYYSLRTALQFSTAHGAPDTLLVTSSRPAEGKSTTAYAIALTLARVGKRVLLADGDLRNPSMHRVVGTDNDIGMSNLLSGSAELVDVTKKTSQPNLDFIPCGPLPPNPAELWGGDRLRETLQQAITEYDHVVIDGPPVLGFADAPVLSAAVAGTVFVLESRSTRRAQARGALRRLAMGKGHLLGAVLTKFNSRTVQYGGYDYAYDYNYGARDAGKAK